MGIEQIVMSEKNRIFGKRFGYSTMYMLDASQMNVLMNAMEQAAMEYSQQMQQMSPEMQIAMQYGMNNPMSQTMNSMYAQAEVQANNSPQVIEAEQSYNALCNALNVPSCGGYYGGYENNTNMGVLNNFGQPANNMFDAFNNTTQMINNQIEVPRMNAYEDYSHNNQYQNITEQFGDFMNNLSTPKFNIFEDTRETWNSVNDIMSIRIEQEHNSMYNNRQEQSQMFMPLMKQESQRNLMDYGFKTFDRENDFGFNSINNSDIGYTRNRHNIDFSNNDVIVQAYKPGMMIDGGLRVYGRKGTAILNMELGDNFSYDIHHHNYGGGRIQLNPSYTTEKIEFELPWSRQRKLTEFCNSPSSIKIIGGYNND
jgi:hypothetical protein